LVTLTTGGNDVGFSAILAYCAATEACHEKFIAAAGGGTDPLEINIASRYQDLYNLYTKIQEVSPDASVFVLGYPNLFSNWRESSGCRAYNLFEKDEVAYLQGLNVKLNELVKKVAADAGVHFVDLANSAAGSTLRGICAPTSEVDSSWSQEAQYLNTPPMSNTDDNVHPNRKGHRAYLDVLRGLNPLSFPFNPQGDGVDPIDVGASEKTYEIGFIIGDNETKPDAASGELVGSFDIGEGLKCRVGFRCQFGVKVRGSDGDEWSAFVYSDPIAVGSGQVQSDGTFELKVDDLQLPAGHHTLVIEITGPNSVEVLVHEFYVESGADSDGDGVQDAVDNCVDDANPGQEDADGDGIGDVCDTDDSAEGRPFIVRLKGDTGDERFEVRVAGRALAHGQATADWQSYEALLPDGTHIGDIQLVFVNDAVSGSYDRNLRVDYVDFDGRRFESESPTTFGTGTWRPSSQCLPGFLQSEELHCNGYFLYHQDPPSPDPIPFVARIKGDTGDELFALEVSGRVVSHGRAGTDWQSHEASLPDGTALSDVQVVFVNDAVSGSYDRNLRVDYVEFDGKRYESEALTTFGTGTYRPSSRCRPGYLQSEALHCNGFFRYE